ncbi:uncharacterized protein [Aristolochia californica]|uniref:uncharacterized protein n=1 Tax=Aristolochia californica TaxID=171875 RepID=UPI0035E15796
MKKHADLKRRESSFNIVDQVLLKLRPEQFRHLRSKNKGLLKKYEGPFPIIERVGNLAYKLQLLKMFKFHNIFHVSNLKPYFEDPDPDRVVDPRAPMDISTTFDNRVEYIIADREERERGNPRRTQYLVKWQGQLESEATWQDAAELWQFEKEVADYCQGLQTRSSALWRWEYETEDEAMVWPDTKAEDCASPVHNNSSNGQGQVQ